MELEHNGNQVQCNVNIIITTIKTVIITTITADMLVCIIQKYRLTMNIRIMKLNLKWNCKESDDDIGERKVGDEEVGHRLRGGNV